MKKYITISALLVAGTAFANAEEVALLNLDAISSASKMGKPANSTSFDEWDQKIGTKTGLIDSDGMTANLTNELGAPLLSSGWHWGAANLNDPGNDFQTIDTGFSFIGRQGYNGEFVAATVLVSDLLGSSYTSLTNFSVSFNAEGQSDIYFSAWSWDGTVAKELITASTLSTSSLNTKTWTATNEDSYLDKDDTIIVLWAESSGGQTNKITNLSSSATLIPEPSAFGLLAGLGALALVGARRRRK